MPNMPKLEYVKYTAQVRHPPATYIPLGINRWEVNRPGVLLLHYAIVLDAGIKTAVASLDDAMPHRLTCLLILDESGDFV